MGGLDQALLDRPGGRAVTLRAFATARRKRIWIPIPAFLVEHPSAGPFLVDVPDDERQAAQDQLPKDHTILLGFEGADVGHLAEQLHGLADPLTQQGAYLTGYYPNIFVSATIPKDAPPGK